MKMKSKSCVMKTGNLLIVKKSEPATIKSNNRSPNLSELNINKTKLLGKVLSKTN
jgi:hypothetical protein